MEFIEPVKPDEEPPAGEGKGKTSVLPPQEPATESPAEVIILQNRYRVVRRLGGGGMGQVYLACDTRLADKKCAVKQLVPDPHLTPGEQQQAAELFRREAAILANLNHPNLPDVFDYFEEGGCFYLVMDYVEGETLADRLKQSPSGLPQEAVLEWALQLCDVLDYLHTLEPPVIFRDMKPANIMVTPGGQIKLIDFGVARLFNPEKQTDTLKMGTAGYAPPEQYAGQGQTTPRSDIYALGATLYELLTGDDPTAHPFVFTPPNKLRPAISATLSEAVMRAVALDPAARFPSARAMKEALEKATRPRRALPLIQPRRGTGPTSPPPDQAVLAGTARPRPLGVRLLQGIGRAILTVVLAVVLTAVALAIVLSFILSFVAERSIVNADWELEPDTTRSVINEWKFNQGAQEALAPYALDAIHDIRLDFTPPDQAALSFMFSDTSVGVYGRVSVRNALPAVQIQRINEVPLYIVGGIVSDGINRGFRKVFEASPVRVTDMIVEDTQLTVLMTPR